MSPCTKKSTDVPCMTHARYLANRGSRITPAGPGAIRYFIGYRIAESYVQRHGKDSWKDLYTLPVREILARSGYAF